MTFIFSWLSMLIQTWSFKELRSVVLSNLVKLQINQRTQPLNIFSSKLQLWGTRICWRPVQEKLSTNILVTSSLGKSQWRIHHSGFSEDCTQGHWNKVSGSQHDEVPHFGRSVQTRWISLKATITDRVWERSGNISEHKRWKPNTIWHIFLDWSSSWSGILRLPVPSLSWFRSGRGSSHSLTSLAFQ